MAKFSMKKFYKVKYPWQHTWWYKTIGLALCAIGGMGAAYYLNGGWQDAGQSNSNNVGQVTSNDSEEYASIPPCEDAGMVKELNHVLKSSGSDVEIYSLNTELGPRNCPTP
jgi:hypothetical protein